MYLTMDHFLTSLDQSKPVKTSLIRSWDGVSVCDMFVYDYDVMQASPTFEIPTQAVMFCTTVQCVSV